MQLIVCHLLVGQPFIKKINLFSAHFISPSSFKLFVALHETKCHSYNLMFIYFPFFFLLGIWFWKLYWIPKWSGLSFEKRFKSLPASDYVTNFLETSSLYLEWTCSIKMLNCSLPHQLMHCWHCHSLRCDIPFQKLIVANRFPLSYRRTNWRVVLLLGSSCRSASPNATV